MTRPDIHRRRPQSGIESQGAISLNRLETVVAMVEAGQGIAIVPAPALPLCRHRNVTMTRLVNPTVVADFYQIRGRGRKLPPATEEFSSYLQGYIARWAGRAGIS